MTNAAAADIVYPIRANYNSNIICIYSLGPKVTHFLGVQGGELACLHMTNAEFDREYYRVKSTLSQFDFAKRYTRTLAAMRMIPISGRAKVVLAAILRAQYPNAPADGAAQPQPVENLIMATTTAQATFRKPDGPVAQVHVFLDKKLEQIKAGKVSRKELIEAMVAKGLSEATVTTQAGHWAKLNGVTFTRPAQAAVAKKAAAKASRAKGSKAKAAN
jgi:hypothetical protein